MSATTPPGRAEPDEEQHIEREVKLDLAPDTVLPELSGVVRLGERRSLQLRATYLDTPGLDLVRSRVTLRRRRGGTDEGWHLKLPRRDGARTELHAPLVGDRLVVPAGHRATVAAIVGDAPLVPVAELSTRRVEQDLCDAAGHVHAVLCDDTVVATPSGRTWRELEVELAAGGDAEVAARVVRALLEVDGITPSVTASKLARALGDPLPAPPQPGPRSTAAEVLQEYVRRQVGVLQHREAGVREGDPVAVHRSRVAVRRLRSLLRVFRRLLHRRRSERVRRELAALGEALGRVRDVDVLRAGLLERPDAAVEGAGRVSPAVRDRVARELDERRRTAMDRLVAFLDSDQHARLTHRLVHLAAEAPWKDRARGPATVVLPPFAERAARRVDRRLRRWDTATDTHRQRGLHEARKAAKAVRYAEEALVPALGHGAESAAGRWEAVTELLGAAQDAAVGREFLAHLAADHPEAGEDVTSGLEALWRQERRRGRAAERAGLQALERARKR